MLIVTEAFIVVSTAQEAVDRLAALHERATTALSLMYIDPQRDGVPGHAGTADFPH